MEARTCRECGVPIDKRNISGFCRSHRMKALHADPEFAERSRERMKALHADPFRNPLVLLTPAERADYDVLVRKGGLDRATALAAIGRDDLNRKAG